jgi:hypothetical protein
MDVIDFDIHDMLDFPGRGVQLTLSVRRTYECADEQRTSERGQQRAAEGFSSMHLQFLLSEWAGPQGTGGRLIDSSFLRGFGNRMANARLKFRGGLMNA